MGNAEPECLFLIHPAEFFAFFFYKHFFHGMNYEFQIIDAFIQSLI